jgi:hypothetical protein
MTLPTQETLTALNRDEIDLFWDALLVVRLHPHLISRSFKLSYEMLFSFPLRYLCSISLSFLYLALGVAYPLPLGIDLKIPDS